MVYKVDDESLAKDSEVDAVYLFENGAVTTYYIDKTYFKDDIALETLGDFSNLSDKEIKSTLEDYFDGETEYASTLAEAKNQLADYEAQQEAFDDVDIAMYAIMETAFNYMEENSVYELYYNDVYFNSYGEIYYYENWTDINSDIKTDEDVLGIVQAYAKKNNMYIDESQPVFQM